MGVLDQVISLRGKGISDQEIIRMLQQSGVSPAEIGDAFGRAQIKSAVSNNGMEQGMEHSILGSEDEPERLPLEGLEGGTLSDSDLTPPTPGAFTPIPRNIRREISEDGEEIYEPQDAGSYYPQQQYAPQQYAPQQYAPEYQEYVPQEGSQYPIYPATGGVLDTDTMIEVSEQVFMEKNKPLQKKLDEIGEFKALSQTKIDHISERLKKIEAVIDRLQASILEKVGGYGHGLETVKKEVIMMQDSLGKIVSQIAEKSHETHHHTVHHHSQSQQEHHSQQQHHQHNHNHPEHTQQHQVHHSHESHHQHPTQHHQHTEQHVVHHHNTHQTHHQHPKHKPNKTVHHAHHTSHNVIIHKSKKTTRKRSKKK